MVLHELFAVLAQSDLDSVALSQNSKPRPAMVRQELFAVLARSVLDAFALS